MSKGIGDCSWRCILTAVAVGLVVGFVLGRGTCRDGDEPLPTPFSGVVWQTADQDCEKSQSEDGLAGFVIQVIDEEQAIRGAGISRADGTYAFTATLTSGTYVVQSVNTSGLSFFCDTDTEPGGDDTQNEVVLKGLEAGTAQEARFAYKE